MPNFSHHGSIEARTLLWVLAENILFISLNLMLTNLS
jgi:hypothetical protein